MSIKLMTKVWETSLPTTRKIVLLALADNANDEGACYPSIATIAIKCSLKERVIYECLSDLEAAGYIKRQHRTGKSTIYHLLADSWDRHPCTTCTPASDAPLHNMHPTPAPDAGVPLHHVHPTPAPRAPITVIEPSIEPSVNHTTRARSSTRELASIRAHARDVVPAIPGVSQQVLKDYLAVRKAKRAGPLTETALAGLRREAAKAGYTIEQALTVCCQRGWVGFKAEWIADRPSGRQARIDAYAAQAAAARGETDDRTGNIIDIEAVRLA